MRHDLSGVILIMRLLIRPLHENDDTKIAALFDRCMTTDIGLSSVSSADWRHFVDLPQNKNGRDFRVAMHGNRIVGLAESSLRHPTGRSVRFFKITVEPMCRRQRIGTQLLRTLLDFDPGRSSHSLHTLTPDRWKSGSAFLSAYGFVKIESEISMRCHILRLQQCSRLEDISFARSVDPCSHLQELTQLNNSAYQNCSAFYPCTLDEMAQQLRGGDLWVAYKSSRPIAFCMVQQEQNRIWLESIAVAPAHQGFGIGTALMNQVLSEQNIGPQRPAGLSVSSTNLAALKIYEKMGFSEISKRTRFAASHTTALALV
jgi:ribosomal protein S18 acetylase RimI-like enzyme